MKKLHLDGIIALFGIGSIGFFTGQALNNSQKNVIIGDLDNNGVHEMVSSSFIQDKVLFGVKSDDGVVYLSPLMMSSINSEINYSSLSKEYLSSN